LDYLLAVFHLHYLTGKTLSINLSFTGYFVGGSWVHFLDFADVNLDKVLQISG
jgi:hypothetical protein